MAGFSSISSKRSLAAALTLLAAALPAPARDRVVVYSGPLESDFNGTTNAKLTRLIDTDVVKNASRRAPTARIG